MKEKIQVWIVALVAISIALGVLITLSVGYIRETREVGREAVERVQKAQSECSHHWNFFIEEFVDKSESLVERDRIRFEALLRREREICLSAALELEAMRDER